MTEKKGNIGKKIMYGVILLALCMPLIQQLTKFAYVRKLHGAIEEVQAPTLTSQTWFNGKFQDSSSKYITNNFGFRNDFIRINNERFYYLYNEAKANGIVIGKENYLYEKYYISAYYGQDFYGEDSIRIKLKKLKFIQKTLQSKGKDILIVFAPGKASYLPEYIPDNLRGELTERTNINAYRAGLKSNNIDFIDFNQWFIDAKDTTSYPLYPKAGIHWSKYAEYLVIDSLVLYMESSLKKNLPDFVMHKLTVDDNNKEGDYDIGEAMNIYSKLPTYPMAYPECHFEQGEQYYQPRIMVVGDSYYWGLHNRNLSKKCFKEGQFWFYNESIYKDGSENPIKTKSIDIVNEVEKNERIIILSTDANLDDFGFGFIEDLYEAYQKE